MIGLFEQVFSVVRLQIARRKIAQETEYMKI